MKSIASSRTFAAFVATLALGTFAAIAFAGPGPHYWSKAPNPTPPAKPAASACGGCSDAAQWKISDRSPSGKGVPGASVASRTHSCNRCSGDVVSTPSQTKDTMSRATACGAMVCCK